MKKLLALLLVAAMSISMVACGGSASSSAASSEAGSEAASSEAASSDVKIGVCIYQFADNFMTLYRNDIKADLEALGYKEGTNFTMVDGAGRPGCCLRHAFYSGSPQLLRQPIKAATMWCCWTRLIARVRWPRCCRMWPV